MWLIGPRGALGAVRGGAPWCLVVSRLQAKYPEPPTLNPGPPMVRHTFRDSPANMDALHCAPIP